MPAFWMRDVLACLATLLVAAFLAEAYALLAQGAASDWFGAALLNTLLAALVVLWHWRRGRQALAGLFASRGVPEGAPGWLAKRPWLAYAPALLVLMATAGMSLMGRLFGGAPRPFDIPSQLAFIVWIPWIEELVFRAGAGGLYRRYVGGFTGLWCSALLFALAHASPTLSHLLQLEVGLPLGPFLLGLACEILVAWTGSLMPAVALHTACNATVVVFAVGDARFLDWLGALYG